MTKPINHHYVPQHFLRAWARPDAGDRLTRYQRIPGTDKFECKIVGIKNTASKDNLYQVSFPDGSFEIESSIMTPELDEPGHKIIDRVRTSPFDSLTHVERSELAVYLVCLEARHPDTLSQMDVREHLDDLRQKHKSDSRLDPRHVDEVIDYFKGSPSVGVIALGALVKNERNGALDTPFAKGLMNANVVELSFHDDVLLTSDFPGFRSGHFLGHFFYAIAVSPRKALIYSPKNEVSHMQSLPSSLVSRLINLYTLAYAVRAYGEVDDVAPYVERYLGWARHLQKPGDEQAYVHQFLLEEFGRLSVR